jgi:CspA family cold shock protein
VKAPAPTRHTGANDAGQGRHLETGGTVKWYNSEKGFGFISRQRREDVIVHATALGRSGIAVLEEGQKVFVKCGQAKKG